jgi:PAS domain S-box-containing protein
VSALPTVMIVDDVAAERRLMRLLLERSGRFHVAAEAGDGIEAVERAPDIQPDLILLDLSMPRMDGLEALPLLRTVSPRSQIIVMSGFSAVQQADAVVRLGAHSYMEKGASIQTILDHLSTVPLRSADRPPPRAATAAAAAMTTTPGSGVAGRGVVSVRARAATASVDQAVFREDVINALHEGVIVVDAAGTILACNPGAERLLDRPREELTGSTTAAMGWALPADHDRAEHDPAGLPGPRAIRTGLSQRGVTVIVEGAGRSRRLLVNSTPLSQPGRAPHAAVSTFIDVTDRRPVDDQLLAVLFDGSPDLLALVDDTGHAVRANAAWAAILGWSEVQVLGRALADLVHPEDRGRFIRGAAVARTGGDDPLAQVQIRFCKADGSYRWVQWVLRPMQQGRLLVASGSDVTDSLARTAELEAQRAELTRSNAELAQFAQVASHDLSEPLRLISGFAELLVVDHGDDLPDPIGEYLRYIGNASDRMQSMITDLLAYARVGRDAQPPVPVPMDEVVDDVRAVLAGVIHETGATITCGALPVVLGRAPELRQLVQNLLSNAIKFRAPDSTPTIRIAVADDDGGELVRIHIDDDGIGIPSGQRDRVFGMFQRLHHQGEHPGTGIGLAICRKVVDLLDGTIGIEDAPGGGTRIVLGLRRVGHTPRVDVTAGHDHART